MNDNILREAIEGIIGAADELLKKKGRDLVEQGQMIAYAESLAIIQDALAGYDLADFGLDFDVDTKYLI